MGDHYPTYMYLLNIIYLMFILYDTHWETVCYISPTQNVFFTQWFPVVTGSQADKDWLSQTERVPVEQRYSRDVCTQEGSVH